MEKTLINFLDLPLWKMIKLKDQPNNVQTLQFSITDIFIHRFIDENGITSDWIWGKWKQHAT